MKNLLIYMNPKKDFNSECKILVKIQIDNSLDLGWKEEDIMLVTNFDYEHRGIKSLVVDDDNCCFVDMRTSKIDVINYLFKQDLIKEGEMYWFHDFDAYQLNPITEEELEMSNIDIGLTDYGWSLTWNTGSIFFKSSAKDIFELIKDTVYAHKFNEEEALMLLTKYDTINVNRYKRLNVTYNFGMKKIDYNRKIATKPIKVLHFHPRKKGLLEKFKPLMTDNLIGIMKKHGYE